ncbi:hypothetical protein CEXT_234611 [Caerostris extrusa]|uniref:Uncharacterized protein n=1 Tax=Caerostris extrusa TaxID=172846 RepID=A0AAV4M5A9_CAEEX|nr:hypothetical protein CEXT_234611 [Caerostris extrusa]
MSGLTSLVLLEKLMIILIEHVNLLTDSFIPLVILVHGFPGIEREIISVKVFRLIVEGNRSDKSSDEFVWKSKITGLWCLERLLIEVAVPEMKFLSNPLCY